MEYMASDMPKVGREAAWERTKIARDFET